MVGDEGRQKWSKRASRAQCREPFKTELDTLADHWIEGQLSNEALALELWKFRESLLFSESPSMGRVEIPLPEVHLELEILVQAMIGSDFYPSTTADIRRALLERTRLELLSDRASGR